VSLIKTQNGNGKYTPYTYFLNYYSILTTVHVSRFYFFQRDVSPALMQTFPMILKFYFEHLLSVRLPSAARQSWQKSAVI